MPFFDKLLGRPLASGEHKHQQLSVMTGVPALGLDAFSSTAYGPEAALLVLLPLGVAGLHYFFLISIAIVAVLFILYLSYQQTAAAYPNGGGAYIVASDNLGKKIGLWAAVALLLDYLLNVAVGISAGIGAIVSAIPALHPYTLILCLFVLLILTILNLRGIRESGLAFLVPTLAFVVCIGISIGMGLAQAWQTGGHPHPVIAPPAAPSITATVSIWLLLGAFANGLTAMTGVEAVSNAIPLFRKPTVKNAQLTLTVIIGILGLFVLSLGYLCPAYHIIATNENHFGYQTILSQLVAAVAGKGIFYYISTFSIFIVLTYSAQTSFIDFPRVCRLLAEDNFLPYFFVERGRRLVFSHGILVLTIFSAVLIILFGGMTNKLIPLFAVGSFTAFFLSQLGMVVHWRRKNKKNSRTQMKLILNVFGAVTTAIALVIIISAKFIDGAWIIVFIAPLIVLLLTKINRHYKKIASEVEKPIKLKIAKLQPPIVIIPIQSWNTVVEKAVKFGLLLSDDITCIHVSTEINDDKHWLRKIWEEKVEKPAKAIHSSIPKLEIIKSPYRRIHRPILDFMKKIKSEKTNRLIAILIPELIEPHWYEYLLHNIHATALRTSLFLERDQRFIVITIPWYLREQPIHKK